MKKRSTSIFAKQLVSMSLEDDFISLERVNAVLEVLRQKQPRNFLSLLETYQTKIKAQLRHEEAFVEYAGSLDEAEIAHILDGLSKHYGRKLRVKTKRNDALLAGVCVHVGDDVWDASALGRLQSLSEVF